MNKYNSYEIAGMGIGLLTDNKYMQERLKPFIANGITTQDMSSEIRRCDFIEEPKGEVIVDEFVKWLRKNNGRNGFHVYKKNERDLKIMAHMDTDRDWSHIIIKCLDMVFALDEENPLKDWMEYYSFVLMGIAFRNGLINRGGLVIHASSIAWRDRGILFTAPSGTGKSTHTSLWEKYMGDEVKVVNDDTPAIRFFDEVPALCGTPWSGSSDKFANIKVPLKAIVVLEQAPENSIRRLNQIEALPLVMPRAFLPYFDRELMEKTYDILDKIILQVPVYLLRCTPAKQAMELVYECVK